MPEMRLFIAVPIEEKLKQKIVDFQNVLKSRIDNFKWSSVHTFHLTLKFIGEVDINSVTAICSKAEDIAQEINPLNLSLQSVGYFGSKNSPRVIWLGVEGDVDVLDDAASKFDEAMQDFGIIPEAKKYNPHLTLARAMRSVNGEQVHRVLVEYEDIILGDFVADEIIVYQSELQADGAKHHPIKTISLK